MIHRTCAVASLLSSLSLAAACGPAATSSSGAGPVSNQPAGPVAAAVAAPCPSGPELLAAAARAWSKPSTAGLSAECVALRVDGETLWYLDGWWEGGEAAGWNVGMWSALVTPSGETRWVDGADDLPPAAIDRGGTTNHQAIDLDGDGTDELVFEANWAHHGYEDGSLVVMRVRADGVASAVPADGLVLITDNSAAVDDPADAVTCQGSYRFVDDGPGKRLEITYSGQCERVGTRAWRLAGDKLVEITP